tara:strand:+ start:106 stop:447 length:342 start_codon:yes stop_codon:yes gene_type:complete
MKAIFKIEEYLPDTKQIVVRFSRLKSYKTIDEHRTIAISLVDLDTYDLESFSQSLMREVGDRMIEKQDADQPVHNEYDVIEGKFDIKNLVGKKVLCKIDNHRREILKMRRVVI